jgi:hypothetical protein
MPSGHSVLQVRNVVHSLFSVSHLKIAAAGVPRYSNFRVADLPTQNRWHIETMSDLFV